MKPDVTASARRTAARREPAQPASADPAGGSVRPALSLSLQFADASHRAVLPRHKVARWIRAALEAPAEITVRIVGTDEGRALNRDYRAQDHATNVLTFDYQRAPVVVADLVLCAPVVEREAAAMEARETEVLRGLGFADPYAG